MVPIRIRLPYATDEEFVEKYGTNVARGGIFIATRALKPEGTLLQFELVLADGARLMRGEGVVVKAQVDDGGARAGMTVRFTRLDAASKALVDRVVARRSEASEPAPPPQVREAPGAEEHPKPQLVSPAPPDAGRSEAEEAEDAIPDRRRRRVALELPESPPVGTGTPVAELVLGIDLGTTSSRAAVFIDGAPRLVPLPQDGRSFSLLALKEAAQEWTGRPISKAVLSAPAGYGDRQRKALLEAGRQAGLDVLRLVNAPSAAALAFGFGRGLARKRVLVYDLGAGSFDASIVEITGDDLDVVASGSAPVLGGADVEQGVPDELVDRTIDTTRTVLAAANLAPNSLDEVLLVGGQSRSPQVRLKLAEALGRPARDDVDPFAVVAMGAAILGHSLLQQAEGKSGARVSEILTVPIGIAQRDGTLIRVLERQTRLPAEKTQVFPLKAGEPLSIVLFQGEGGRVEDGELLGTAQLRAEKDGEARMVLRLAVDGTLELSARAPGARHDVLLSTRDPGEALPSMLAEAPAPSAPEPASAPGGILGGIRRLFGRR